MTHQLMLAANQLKALKPTITTRLHLLGYKYISAIMCSGVSVYSLTLPKIELELLKHGMHK